MSDGMTREEMINNADINPSEYGKKNQRGGLGKRVRFQAKPGEADEAMEEEASQGEDEDAEDEGERELLNARKAQTVLLSCMGIGMRNLARVAT